MSSHSLDAHRHAAKPRNSSYNRYLSIAARTVRKSLKDDLRVKAEQRGQMELRFAKWEVSLTGRKSDPPAEALTQDPQNGKQGENKSLAKALDETVAEDAHKQS